MTFRRRRLSRFLKWIPAASRQRPPAATLAAHNQLCFLGDVSNLRELYALDSSCQKLRLLRRHRKQQFVVVSAVQGKLQGIQALLSRRLKAPDRWNSFAFEPRPDAACRTQTRQVA